MKILITESQSIFLKRRLNEIGDLVSLSLRRVDPEGYNYHDYVEEIVWQVADSYETKLNEEELGELLDFVRNNYWKQIEDYYMTKF
jgi:hypothetical protein